MKSTLDEAYTRRLSNSEGVWWKQLIDVQAPDRWNLKRLQMGFTLDIGCGLGRNLKNLRGAGVGVDHNAHSVAEARSRGFEAYTSSEFLSSPRCAPESFDSLLFAHVAEHMPFQEARELLRSYLPYLKPGGKIVVLTPQEAGFKSDPTHVEFMDDATIGRMLDELGAKVLKTYSYPFPRFVGRFFVHNAFVSVAEK